LLAEQGEESMNKITKQKLSHAVIRNIRKSVLLGEFRMDQHLSEPLLADYFGISRGPVREALDTLVREGFVERQPNGRVVVKGLTTGDIAKMYDVRFLMESYALRTWTESETRNPDLLKAAEAIIALMAGKLTGAEDFSRYDMDFHERLIRLADNRPLLQAWTGIRDTMNSILEITNQGSERPEDVISDHQAMIMALNQGDCVRASHILKEHLAVGERYMCAKIEQALSETV
jgi:DNA-binding GntR family transcriptional regulator